MQRNRPIHPATVSASVAFALLAAAIVTASGVLGRESPVASPTSPPVISAPPSVVPALPVPPTPMPVGGNASDGIDLVDLENSYDVPSSIVVWDESDSLADARSGIPGDGVSAAAVSVAEDEIAIARVDEDTIRLTWSDLPIASQARLTIHMSPDGRFDLRLLRVRPSAPTDALASDRVLELDFNVAVPLEDVDVSIVDTTDNGG